MALGIGATTAIFSVVHGVLLKPLPYADADRVVRVRVTAPETTTAASSAPAGSGPSVSASLGSVTVTELIELRSRIKGLSHLSFRGGPSFVTMSGMGETKRPQGMHAAPGAFEVLGVTPFLGRTFGASEEVPGAEPVMLLAYGTWQRQFNNDSDVVGRTVTLANALGGPATPTTHTIVGVMPRGFEFPDAQMQFWTPVRWTPRSSGSLIARLADNVSMPAAAAELEALLREIGLVLGQSLVLTAAGIVLGIAAAAALARYLEGMLFGLTPLDPATWTGVAVLFAIVAAVAAYVPARRATAIDPLRALRTE